MRQIISKFLAIILVASVPVIGVGQVSRFGPATTPSRAVWTGDESSPNSELEAPLFLHVPLPVMAPEIALQTFESRGVEQNSALKGYTDQTLVMAELTDSSQRGAFELQRSFVAPHTLAFKPIRYTGDTFVKSNVIARILQSEVDYVTKGDSAETALTPANYKFSYKGDRELNGKDVHVFQVKPRQKRAGLFKGYMYLDTVSGSLVRSEGTIVKSPSFFIRNIQFVEDYTDIDGYTLPVQLHTTAKARFVGPAVVDIFHRQYQPQPVAALLSANQPAAGQP
jgi:hypothetical protein